MSHSKVELEFRQSLSDTDYGLIIGADGNLKGIWVPNSVADDADIPEAIVHLCVSKFGVDPNAEEHEQPRFH